MSCYYIYKMAFQKIIIVLELIDVFNHHYVENFYSADREWAREKEIPIATASTENRNSSACNLGSGPPFQSPARNKLLSLQLKHLGTWVVWGADGTWKTGAGRRGMWVGSVLWTMAGTSQMWRPFHGLESLASPVPQTGREITAKLWIVPPCSWHTGMA